MDFTNLYKNPFLHKYVLHQILNILYESVSTGANSAFFC